MYFEKKAYMATNNTVKEVEIAKISISLSSTDERAYDITLASGEVVNPNQLYTSPSLANNIDYKFDIPACVYSNHELLCGVIRKPEVDEYTYRYYTIHGAEVKSHDVRLKSIEYDGTDYTPHFYEEDQMPTKYYGSIDIARMFRQYTIELMDGTTKEYNGPMNKLMLNSQQRIAVDVYKQALAGLKEAGVQIVRRTYTNRIIFVPKDVKCENTYTIERPQDEFLSMDDAYNHLEKGYDECSNEFNEDDDILFDVIDPE